MIGLKIVKDAVCVLFAMQRELAGTLTNFTLFTMNFTRQLSFGRLLFAVRCSLPDHCSQIHNTKWEIKSLFSTIKRRTFEKKNT